jgi:plasmid stabilization system protein ParE
MVEGKRIVWDESARLSLRKAYEYIKKDSLSNALKVRKEILDAIKQLPTYPKIHPPDKYKQLNDGNFRSFEKYSLRISYYVGEREIIILRIRHVKQRPEDY